MRNDTTAVTEITGNREQSQCVDKTPRVSAFTVDGERDYAAKPALLPPRDLVLRELVAQRPLRLAAARDGERRERLRLGRSLASLRIRCDRPEPHGTQSVGVHTECTQRIVAEM